MASQLAKIVANALKGQKIIGARPLTLLKTVAGTRTAASGGTNPTTTPYKGTGFISVLEASSMPGTLVQQNDRRIVILGATLAVVPSPQDRVTIADVDGVTRTFVLVGPIAGDGVGAAYTFQARL